MTPLKYLTTLICFVFIAIRAASGEVRNEFGEVGGEVSFGSTSLNPSVSSIIWKHRSSTGPVVKAIEWDPAEDPDVSIPNPRFKDITTLNEKTGEITITNLTVEHSGFYTIDINSKEQEQRFSLTVMESGLWWIALIVIPVLILALFVLLYKFWTKSHRKQYNLASEGNKMKEDAVSPVSMSLITDQKNVYKNGISDATQR
ncbi:uncharacterized protein LOC109069471 isoform X6 [Cyprinus carpio]|uniref:Uncharacterized protein LOC109069471 isoform X6 n=1 Tax=Cyprinus carpio TaxID=7962 RepID=A0A9Q9ZT51_CYPCA|nr:uncharacterized protein LOC109069471 isoform X6 [Cyprinus carpio]